MIRILTATVAVMLASSASAADIVIVDNVPTAHVSYADLNLQSQPGRDRLARRIRVAAEEVCEGASIETSIIEPQRNECYASAVASGIRQMNEIAGL